MPSLDSTKLLSNFLFKIKVEDGLSSNTISSYHKDLELFLNFLIDRQLDFLSATEEILIDYLRSLDDAKLKPSSISRKISCLRKFYNFLEIEDAIKLNPVSNLELPKKSSKLPRFLSESEMVKLLDQLNRDKSEFGIRFSCMLEILYCAGLRISELLSIQVDSIYRNAENGSIKKFMVIRGKGNKERMVPLGVAAIKKLEEYLYVRKLNNYQSKWLFPGNVKASKIQKDKITKGYRRAKRNVIKEDKHMTRQHLHKMLKALARIVNVDEKKVHPHSIRHSFATHILENGIDIRILQELLGHSDISTTEIYTHLSSKKLEEAVKRFHPISLTKK